MIPHSSIAQVYVKIVGQDSLLAMAQSNLLYHLERIAKVRTHTFLSHNGQTAFGISQNFGCERYYSWDDTVIDCSNSPALLDSETLRNFDTILSENRRFMRFKNSLENRMDGLIEIEPFYSVLRGEENMRYNIRHDSKIEDFDIIRVGIRLSASCEGTFKQGLSALHHDENPFSIRKSFAHA